MSSTGMSSEAAAGSSLPGPGELWLEVVLLPVADVDRAKQFYASLGWRLDADLDLGGERRVVQFTPPGSRCSVSVGKGLTSAEPGSAQGLEIAVSDIGAAREELVRRGVEVSEPFHRAEAGFEPGPDPEGRSYFTYASFEDPDGNGWLLQEITERLPGR
jgi:catechol 2,3-dioxygenase-like lactoylglutathione lyase family enzyme